MDHVITHSSIDTRRKTNVFQLEEINHQEKNKIVYPKNNSTTNLSSKQFSLESKDSKSSTNSLNKSGDIREPDEKMSTKSQNSYREMTNKPPSNTIMTVSEVNSKSSTNNSNNQNQSLNQNTSNNNVVDPNSNKEVEESKPVKKPPIKVTSRIVFLKVGQIDTRNERYDAEAYIEASWEDEKIYKILADPNMIKNMNTSNGLELMIKAANSSQLNPNPIVNLKNVINNVNALEFDTNLFWSPQLYIENAIGDLKEEIRHKLEIVEKEGSDMLNDPNFNSKDDQYKNIINNLTVRVCEMRKIRGVFYERLELYDFPMDMQEISITLTSKRSTEEIDLVENKKEPCSINTADFLDQQEWDLFDHVKTNTKIIHDPWRKYDRSGFSVTCFIVRKPGYYLYNAYMLIFLITVLGFVPFAFSPESPQFRCQVTGLLLLTSVNFRWIVTQRLPSVAYLTSLDKYAIGSLLHLVLFCCWHSIIGSNLITSDNSLKKKIDTYVLYGAASFYVLYNFGYLIWFIRMYNTNKNIENQFKKEDELTKSPKELLKKLKFDSDNNSYNQIERNDQASPISNQSVSSRAPLTSPAIVSANNNMVSTNRTTEKKLTNSQQNLPSDPTFLMTNA